MTNLQTMGLKPLQGLHLHSSENVVCFPVKQNATDMTPRLRPRSTAIRERAINTDHLQCFSVKETAGLLGVNTVTVRRMLKSGRLTGPADGRLVRVFQWSLEKYLMANTTATENQDITEPESKPRRTVRSTSHQIAMRELERLGI